MTLATGGVWLANAHEPFTNHQNSYNRARGKLTLCDTLPTSPSGQTSCIPLPLLNMRALSSPLCSLPALLLSHSPHPFSLCLATHVLMLLPLCMDGQYVLVFATVILLGCPISSL